VTIKKVKVDEVEIKGRIGELLSRADNMTGDDIRWNLRVCRECLDEERIEQLFEGYSEYMSLKELRAFFKFFLPFYQEFALKDLQEKGEHPQPSLRGYTYEELLKLPALEKWKEIKNQSDILSSLFLQREMARLLLCSDYGLLLDNDLPLAALEFPLYYQTLEALGKLSSQEIQNLTRDILKIMERVEGASFTEEVQIVDDLQETVKKALHLEGSMQELIGQQMQRWPLAPPPDLDIHAENFEAKEAKGKEQQLSMHLKLITDAMKPQAVFNQLNLMIDLMSLREFQQYIVPLRQKYPTIGQAPQQELKDLIIELAPKLGERSLLDFYQRYKFGKFITLAPVNYEVWRMMAYEGKLGTLRQDNEQMDVAQKARHLAKILFTPQIEILEHLSFYAYLITHPLYHQAQNRLIMGMGQPAEGKMLDELNDRITRMMLDLELVPLPERAAKFHAVKYAINEVVGIPENELAAVKIPAEESVFEDLKKRMEQ
jgi:hypothetical protein